MVYAWLNLNIWKWFFKTNRVKIVVSQKPVVHGVRDLIRMYCKFTLCRYFVMLVMLNLNKKAYGIYISADLLYHY